MRVQAQPKHEEAEECERKLHGSRDKHIPHWRELPAAATCRQTWQRTRKFSTEKSSGRRRWCVLLCRPRIASHGKRRKPEKAQRREQNGVPAAAACATCPRLDMCFKHLLTATVTDFKSLHRPFAWNSKNRKQRFWCPPAHLHTRRHENT